MTMTDDYTTADGLSVTYDPATSAVAAVSLDGRAVAPGQGRTGFFVHDVEVWSDLVGFPNGRCDELGLTLEAAFNVDEGAIRVAGQLTDTTGRDRAATLSFALPIAPGGWTWHDDPRRRHTIQGDQVYVNETDVRAGVTGGMSLYPFGCITRGADGIAVGMDMDCPAICRISYDGPAGRLVISYDVGLVPQTRAFPQAAPFRFVIFRTDGRWGFRSAADRYYGLFPHHFTCRSKDQGIWMPFTNVSEVDGWEDFGFRYHEGIGDEAFDNANGIGAYRYTEPCTFWMPMDPSVPRTHENVLAELGRWAESDDPGKRRQAAAVAAAGSYDADGNVQYRIWRKPWCDGAVFSLNPNPELPGQNEADLYWNDEVKRDLYETNPRGTPAGEYLDSLEAYATEEENFRRDHFAHATAPLTFSTVHRRPMIHKSLSIYEYVRWMADDLHRMDKLLFANDSPNRYAYIAAHLDVMGMEVGWVDDEGLWRPNDDAWLLFKRTICHHRPFVFLLNARFERCSPEALDLYFQRCLFYGMFPSMFSFNAHSEGYWSRPDMYNRDRPLFIKYLPTIKRIAEAGWEPVTGAVSDDPAVYLERFGPDAQGQAYLTALNTAADDREVTIRVAGEVFATTSERAEEMIGGQALPIMTDDDGRRCLRLTLAPQQVAAVALGADLR